MRIHQPKTNYEKMMFVALVNKLRANHTPKKKSHRDGIREFNRTHDNIQLRLRPRGGEASLNTAIMVYDRDGTFIERRIIDGRLQDSD